MLHLSLIQGKSATFPVSRLRTAPDETAIERQITAADKQIDGWHVSCVGQRRKQSGSWKGNRDETWRTGTDGRSLHPA
jgi:hypothetical protein